MRRVAIIRFDIFFPENENGPAKLENSGLLEGLDFVYVVGSAASGSFLNRVEHISSATCPIAPGPADCVAVDSCRVVDMACSPRIRLTAAQSVAWSGASSGSAAILAIAVAENNLENKESTRVRGATVDVLVDTPERLQNHVVTIHDTPERLQDHDALSPTWAHPVPYFFAPSPLKIDCLMETRVQNNFLKQKQNSNPRSSF